MGPSSKRVTARYVSTPWKHIERWANAFDAAFRSKDVDEMGPLLGRDDHAHALAQDGLIEWFGSNHGSFGEVFRLALRKLHDAYMFSGLNPDWDEWWRKVGRLQEGVKEKLSEAGPTHFRWRGFLILNPTRLSDRIVEKGLDHVAHVLALFRKRGVEDVLMATVKEWRFDLSSNYGRPGGAGGWYESKDQSVTFAWTGTSWGKESYETIIHEVGHHLHLRYLHGAAREAWDEPWKDVPEQIGGWLGRMMGPIFDRERAEAIDRLQVPTDYARTNVYEDFAETFTAFVLRPNTLSPEAKFRMQRTLSLSNLYGKKVMRLGSAARVAARHLAAAPGGIGPRDRFYHGAGTESAAEEILSRGIRPPDLKGRGHALTPYRGHVYLSRDLAFASLYAGKSERANAGAQWRYVFVVYGKDLKDVFPDEDEVGELISKETFDWLHDLAKSELRGVVPAHPNRMWVLTERLGDSARDQMLSDGYDPDDPESAADWLGVNPLHDHDSFWEWDNSDLFDLVMGGEYNAWAEAGKILMPLLEDHEVIELIGHGKNVAHRGDVHPSECWRIPWGSDAKLRSYADLKRYGERCR